jgi:hypothetical protein
MLLLLVPVLPQATYADAVKACSRAGTALAANSTRGGQQAMRQFCGPALLAPAGCWVDLEAAGGGTDVGSDYSNAGNDTHSSTVTSISTGNLCGAYLVCASGRLHENCKTASCHDESLIQGTRYHV